MNLSAVQRAAVQLEAPNICVVAGPGSGKTRVLIERFAWLVEQRGVDPGRILAITFTEKAANQMKQRLARRFAYSAEAAEKVETAWLSTIDAFCARLLGEHAIDAGLPPNFSVLEPARAARLLRESAEQVLDELFIRRPTEMRNLMQALDLSTQDDGRQPDLAQSLIETYETIRLAGGVAECLVPRGATPLQSDLFPPARALALEISADSSLTGADVPALLQWIARFTQLPSTLTREHFALAAGMPSIQRLSRKGGGYQKASQLKKEVLPRLESQWARQWYTGSPDLLQSALQSIDKCFEDKKLAISAVDFTGLEEKTIRLLEADSLLRRGIAARFDYILMDELQDTNRLQWRLVNLLRGRLFAVGDINQSIYGFRHADRSVFEEFRAESQTIKLSENHRSRAEILESVERVLDGQAGIEPRHLQAARDDLAIVPDDFPNVARLAGAGDEAEDDEARQVASVIRRWVDSRVYQYCNIAILVRSLNATEPFENAFDRFDIPFLLSGGRTFLEARETRDLLAFLAALVNPLDEIALITVFRSPLMGWSDEQIFGASREQWQAEFEKRFGRIRRLAGLIPPARVIAMALDECGYAAPLNARARANIDKFLGWLRREHDTRPRPLAELLVDLEALREAQAEAEAPPPEATEAVRIISIHAAKGLEFPVVFLSALHRGPDRRTPVILFSRTHGLGLKWRNPATGKGLPDATHRLLDEDRKAAEKEEENRLLYVGMTRAEDRLILSHAERDRESNWVKRAKLIDRIEVAEQGSRGTVVEQASPSNGGSSPRSGIILDRPPLTAQYDHSAPVTDIAVFAACPRKYYLSRYLGLDSQPIAPSTGAINLGIEVHRGLSTGAADPFFLSALSAEARTLAQNFHRSPLGQRAAAAQHVEREFDFEIAMGDIVLRGQIDLWFDEAGELVIVDYKSDREESNAAAYGLQLRLYALALKIFVGRVPDRAVLFYLRSGSAHEVNLSPEALEAARSTVRAFSAAQNSLAFPMMVGEQCRHCSFWEGQCEKLQAKDN